MSLDNLAEVAAFLNSAAGGTWLIAIGSVAVILAGSAVAWMLRRVRAVEEMADPAYNPALDRHQRLLREALQGEADSIPSDDDLDGLAIDWDDEMRRRGR